MKRLLLLSLLLNVLLAGLALRQVSREVPMPRAPRGEVGEPAAGRGARITQIRPTQVEPATAWSRLESRDPRQLMANLRAIGCPEQTVRDIVVFRLCREYRNRLLAEESIAAQAWDFTRDRPPAFWWERNARQRELRDAMQTELDAVLGRSFGKYGLAVTFLGFEDRPDFLPPGKRALMRELETRYRQLREPLEAEQATGVLDTDGAAQLAKLRRQQQAELTQLLSPEEAEEYLFRESAAAQYVRARLPQAKSEAEFRSIVRLATELDLDANAGSGLQARIGLEPADPALAQAEAEREAEFQRRLEALLGKERLAEQEAQRQAEADRERRLEEQRHEEQERARLAAVAADAGIAAPDAERFLDHLKALQPTLESHFTELERTLTGTPEERKRQLETAMKAELEKQAVEVLGDRGRELVRRLIEQQEF